jgi:hypothetical protein
LREYLSTGSHSPLNAVIRQLVRLGRFARLTRQ